MTYKLLPPSLLTKRVQDIRTLNYPTPVTKRDGQTDLVRRIAPEHL